MFVHSFKKTKCINGCTLFNDKSNYIYWEKKSETTDEIEIVKYINKNIYKKRINILHIGIGNSFMALNIKDYNTIDGITISGGELSHALKLNIKNYNVVFLNKLAKDAFQEENISTNYDLIIDVNLKSFSCCKIAFLRMFENYVSKLSNNAEIVTGRQGMNWSRRLKPVYRFSFNNFLYKRLKEIDGPATNILTIKECEDLAKSYNLKFFYNDYICSFKKI